ncbi:MAG: hypothetical protein IT340_09855 [Chloroflexi bacterium]|nr:hypothetical protein [Chloroflexota bacterium]
MTVAPAQAQQALLTTATRLGDAFTGPVEVAVHPTSGSAAWVLEDLGTSLQVRRHDETGRLVVATVPETASLPTFPTYPLFLGGNVEGFDLDQAGNLYIAGEIVDDSAAPRYIYRLTGNPASPVAVVAESFPSGGEPSGNGGPSQGAVFERPRAFRYHRGTNALYFYAGTIVLVGPQGGTDCYSGAGPTYVPPTGVDTTLVRNPPGTFTATHQDQTRWEFDGAGRLTAIVDRFGNQSALTYNTSGQPTTISDPAGRGVLTLTYYDTGRLWKVTDWANPARVVEYRYEGASEDSGRLTKVIDREGSVTQYGYDGTTHRLTMITDPNGHVAVTNHYDAQGRVDWQKDARGLTTGQQTTLSYVTNGDGTKTTTVTYPATSYEPAWNPVVIDHYDTNSRLSSRVFKSTSNSAEWITESYTYDAGNNRTSVTDGRGHTTTFCYDVDDAGQPIAGSARHLTRRIEPAPVAGQPRPVSLFRYDSKHNVIQVIPPKGVASSSTTDCTSNLSGALTLAYATDLTYNATQTTLTAITRHYSDPDLGALSATTKYEYGDAANPGLVTRIIPPRGNGGGSPDYAYAASFAYGASGSQAGMLISMTVPAGSGTNTPAGTTSYTYDSVGRRLTLVDPLHGTPGDHAWEYTYDKEDRLAIMRAPAPAVGGSKLVTEYRYDTAGNRVVAIDASGQVTKFAYDERDSLRLVCQKITAWSDPAPVTACPAGTIATVYTYDHRGNLARVTRASGDASDERATDYTYDGLNRLRAEIQYPNWPSLATTLTSTVTYDLASNRRTVVDPLGQATTFSYDQRNRLTGVDYSDAVTPDVTYQYDANSNRTSMADGTGTTTYVYDELNRLLSVTAPAVPASKTVSCRYDRDGNRRKLLYPDSTAVTYDFDEAGRLWKLTDWAGRVTGYQYHADSLPKVTTNVNGTITAHGYDHARRLTDLWHTLGSTTIARFTYSGLDAVSNRTQLDEVLPGSGGEASSAAWAWGNNNNGQLGDGTATPKRTNAVPVVDLTAITTVEGGGQHSLALLPDGTLRAWGRNADGQLGDNTTTRKLAPIQVQDSAGTGFLSGIGAIAGGSLHSLAVTTSGIAWAWGDNAEGQVGDASQTDRKRPVQVKGPGGAGILTGVAALAGGDLHTVARKADGTAWAWGRNLEGQLGDGTTTRRTAPVAVEDQAGTGVLTGVSAVTAGGGHSLALTGSVATSQTTTYAYDRLYRLTGVTAPGGTTTYTYDPVGNRLSRVRGATTATYSYDRADRITQVVEGGTVAYVVNANGNLTARGADTFAYDQANRLTSATVGGASSTYVHDGDGKRASRAVGGLTTRYVYDPVGLATMLEDGARKYVWGLGLAYATDLAGALQGVYHTDGLGSVRVLTDAAGTVTQTYQTDEFGVPTQAPGGSGQPFGYTGEQQDAETGLIYLRARLYDPATGRFLQRDPYAGLAGSPLSLHRYAYVQNNPVNATDPTGLTPYACQRPPKNMLEMLQFQECLQQEQERYRQRGGQAQYCQQARMTLGVVVPCIHIIINSNDNIDFEEEEEDQGVSIFRATGPGFTIHIIAQVVREGSNLILRGMHIEGPGPNALGARRLTELVQAFGKWQGVTRVTIEGGFRSTGMGRHFPRTMTFDIK